MTLEPHPRPRPDGAPPYRGGHKLHLLDGGHQRQGVCARTGPLDPSAIGEHGAVLINDKMGDP